MKALVKSKPEPGIKMQDVDMPVMGPNDVLIKIKKTAICGTDIHIYNWDEWAQKNIKTPLTIGHEFVGVVADIGKEVNPDFKIGDRVSGEGHLACGFCRNCRVARSHLCLTNISVGVTRNGAFAEYIVLPASNVIPIPDDVPDNVAAILDPLGNAVHTALSYDLIGEDVLITGAGPVGIMAAAVVKHVGARHVVITDLHEYRLNLAKKMGASFAINTKEMKLASVMQQLKMKEGFDIGLEMSGSDAAFNDMIKHMMHAGKIALLGFLPEHTRIEWNQVIMKGLNLKGIYGREMFSTWYKMIAMLQSGLDVTPIITHEFSIDDYQTAFDVMRSGQSGKVVMSWD